MRVLVFGATGQVAKSLLEQADTKVSLIAVGRPENDICDEEKVMRAVDAHEPDVVINAAAYTAVDAAETDEETAYRVNRDGTANIARATSRAGRPLIHYSTDYVYSGDKPSPYVETDPTGPASVYGRSKLAGENAVREITSDHVILRTAWVFSPFGGNFVKTMLRLAEQRDELNVVDDQLGCPTYAPDIAGVSLSIAHAITHGDMSRGVYHLTNKGETSWSGFARNIFKLSTIRGGPDCRVNAIPTTDYPTPAKRPKNSRLDCGALMSDFNLTLPKWQDGLERCLDQLLSSVKGIT